LPGSAVSGHPVPRPHSIIFCTELLWVELKLATLARNGQNSRPAGTTIRLEGTQRGLSPQAAPGARPRPHPGYLAPSSVPKRTHLLLAGRGDSAAQQRRASKAAGIRRYVQGKTIGKEINLYAVWFELRWGISWCVILTLLLITVIFYFHPSTRNAVSLFRTVPILPETRGRVEAVYLNIRDTVKAGQPISSSTAPSRKRRSRAHAAASRRSTPNPNTPRPICSRPTARSRRRKAPCRP
jgi:hypothetical protein